MATGIRFRDGTVIDFQGTAWSIEVDEANDTVTFANSSTGNEFTYRADGVFEALQGFDFSEQDVDFSTVALGTTTIDDTDSPYLTQGEGIVFVDTSGGAVEVQLASGDRRNGLGFTVVDIGGNASNNAITLTTEGTETIDGSSEKLLETDYGASKVASDGSNWFTSGGGGGGGAVEETDTEFNLTDDSENKILAVEKSSGDLSITGELTEGASL